MNKHYTTRERPSVHSLDIKKNENLCIKASSTATSFLSLSERRLSCRSSQEEVMQVNHVSRWTVVPLCKTCTLWFNDGFRLKKYRGQTAGSLDSLGYEWIQQALFSRKTICNNSTNEFNRKKTGLRSVSCYISRLKELKSSWLGGWIPKRPVWMSEGPFPFVRWLLSAAFISSKAIRIVISSLLISTAFSIFIMLSSVNDRILGAYIFITKKKRKEKKRRKNK